MTGTIFFTSPQSTIPPNRGARSTNAATRKRATSSSARCVASGRPIRCGRASTRASRRSSARARCAPRLVPAIGVDRRGSPRAHGARHPPTAKRTTVRQDVQRLRNRDQDVRRFAQHSRPRRGPAYRQSARHKRGFRGKLLSGGSESEFARSGGKGDSRFRWLSSMGALSGETEGRCTAFGRADLRARAR